MIDFLKYFFNPSTIALLLGGILTSLFGFLAATSKEEKTPKWIARGAFLAGIIVLFAGMISVFQQERTSKRLQSKAEQIERLSQKNADLALKNSELNQKIANLVTGGDSYCWVLIGYPTKSNKSEIQLKVVGEYPLYDVKVRIQDMQKFSKIVNEEFREGRPKSDSLLYDFYNRINKSSKTIEMGNISPRQTYYLGELLLPKDANIARYQIQIFARNGYVQQPVQFRKIKGKWIRAWKILFNNKVVDKYLDLDFPRDKKSERFWKK